MLARHRRPHRQAWPSAVAALLLTLAQVAYPGEGHARTTASLDGVVQINAVIPHDARTAATLGSRREGTGVVIDDSGLILTIGYLVLEASEITIEGVGAEPVGASVVAYDHESGFGLVRADRPLAVAPIPLGDSTALRPMQPLLVVSRVGELDAAGVFLVDRRDFAGYWEYLLEDALFTAPPHAQFGGAALLDDEGRLVGIGSLFVGDAGSRAGQQLAGNMFVPIEQLEPIMADLLANGRRSDPPRPWLGVILEEHRGRVFVIRVTPDGPAQAAGVAVDDLILGVDGVQVRGLADLYRRVWGLGAAGTIVPLDVLSGIAVRSVEVRSGDRYRHLRLDPSF